MSGEFEAAASGGFLDSASGGEALSERGDEIGVDEVAAWFEDACHFGDRLGPLGDVVRSLVGVDDVEFGLLFGEVGRVCDEKVRAL